MSFNLTKDVKEQLKKCDGLYIIHVDTESNGEETSVKLMALTQIQV